MKGLRVILSRVLQRLQDVIDGAFREGWLCGDAGPGVIPDQQPQRAPFSPGMFRPCGILTTPGPVTPGLKRALESASEQLVAFGRVRYPVIVDPEPYEWRVANPMLGRPFEMIGFDWSADYSAVLAARAAALPSELDRWADDGGPCQ